MRSLATSHMPPPGARRHPRIRRRTLALASFLGSVCALGLAPHDARADYPIVSHRYLADPGSVVIDGRVYLYNSNDDDNNGGYGMRSVVCVSSADMKNWTDHGVVFSVPANASWAHDSWAPQPVVRDGTIFLYFGNNANGIGVASSKEPAGPFKDAKGSALITGSTPGASGTNMWLFDPGAMVDDDGQAYLSFGGNGQDNGRIIKLGTNMASVVGSAVALSPAAFFEASFLFKRAGLYYFAYSTNPGANMRIDYLTSATPMSGWTYKGIIADQPPQNGNNNHASEFALGGRWYHAYHNRVVAKQAGIDATYKRNLAIEVLDFRPDGSIEPVTYTTDGVPQVGTLNPYVRVEAETMKAQSGIETEACSAGGMDVTSIQDGDWVSVRGVSFGDAGAKTLNVRVASAAGGGSIEVRDGGVSGRLLASCPVPATGGPQSWMTATCNVNGATGLVKDLTFKLTGGNFAFDWWQFTARDGSGAGGAGGAGAVGGGSPGGASGSGGVAETGATGGSGGAPGTGGHRQTGGMATGEDATGGALTRTGGAIATGGAPGTGGGGEAGLVDAEDAPGCACRTSAPSEVSLSSLLLALAWLRPRRRKRSV